jgi:hypothetical protein
MPFTVQLGSIIFGGGPDADGDRFTVRDVPGWTGGGVDLTTVDKPISDGAVVARGRYTGRTLSIVGHGIAPTADAIWRVRNKLEACVTPGADATLTVNEPAPSTTKHLTVRLAGTMRVGPVGPRAVEFEIPLYAANPTKT